MRAFRLWPPVALLGLFVLFTDSQFGRFLGVRCTVALVNRCLVELNDFLLTGCSKDHLVFFERDDPWNYFPWGIGEPPPPEIDRRPALRDYYRLRIEEMTALREEYEAAMRAKGVCFPTEWPKAHWWYLTQATDDHTAVDQGGVT
jgi:hypothetical protein